MWCLVILLNSATDNKILQRHHASLVNANMSHRVVTPQFVKENASDSVYYDTDDTLAPSNDDQSDATSSTDIVELLSDTSSEFGDNFKPRSSSPAPTSASFEVLATVKASSRLPTQQEEKLWNRRSQQAGSQRHRLTEAQQMQIVSLREAGWTHRRIAEHLNCKCSTVSSFVQRRRARIERLVSGLPGSIPRTSHAPASQSMQYVPKPEDPNTNLGHTASARGPAKRETSAAPNFSFVSEDKVEVKRNKQAKDERPF